MSLFGRIIKRIDVCNMTRRGNRAVITELNLEILGPFILA